MGWGYLCQVSNRLTKLFQNLNFAKTNSTFPARAAVKTAALAGFFMPVPGFPHQRTVVQQGP
jgi:hypothetical protein